MNIVWCCRVEPNHSCHFSSHCMIKAFQITPEYKKKINHLSSFSSTANCTTLFCSAKKVIGSYNWLRMKSYPSLQPIKSFSRWILMTQCFSSSTFSYIASNVAFSTNNWFIWNWSIFLFLHFYFILHYCHKSPTLSPSTPACLSSSPLLCIVHWLTPGS